MKRFKNILFLPTTMTESIAPWKGLSNCHATNDARLTVMDVTPEAGLADYIQHTMISI